MPGRPEDVVQRFLADNSDTIDKLRQIGAEYRELQNLLGGDIKITADASQALAEIAKVKTELAGLPDSKTIRIDVDTSGLDDLKAALGDLGGAGFGEITRHLQDISTYMDIATDSMGRMEEHLGVISRNVQDSSADLMMQTQILRDNADAHNLVAVAAGRSATATRDAAAIARDTAAAAYMNAMVAGTLGGGGGGGGGGFAAGTAAASFANVARFVTTWYPAAHWAMMLTNEILATVGPAAVAAGGAALVGLQGGQQLYNRYQALNAVAESLGPSTGQSMATMLGVPNTLQQLQNQYGSGEMYGIAGAGINALRGGAGGPFLALGQQTLSMISGAAADFVLAMQSGLGKAAGDIVQGGTGYLQQFGDVAGNIGKTFLNAAPNLPGVGGMLLSLLQAGTGGLADVTKALGPGLLPVLGFEAGARWGPPIVGGVGAGISGLGNILGDLGRGGILSDIGLGTGTEGGLAGLGAALGGLAAPEIGGIAAATIAVVKGLTAKTAAQQQYAGIANNLILGPSVGGLTNLVQGVGTIASAAAAGGYPVTPGAAGLFQLTGAAGAFGMGAPPSFRDLGGMGGGISQIGTAFGDQTMHGIEAVGDFFTGHWAAALQDVGSIWQDLTGAGGIIHGLGQMLGIVGPPPDGSQAAMQQMGKAFSTWSNVLGAPGQVQDLWKSMGMGALNTADALNVLAQSGVNINTAFQKNGELTAKATQQVKDYVAGYQAVTGQGGGATGATLAAINAGTIVGGLQQSKLAQVNANYDQIVQIASGGASGTAAYETLIQGLSKGTAEALTNVLSPQGAAAWTQFASTSQPSVISTLEGQADWMRTAQVLGGFTGAPGGQAAMMKFLIGQALPAAGQSPMAMSVLGSIAQEYGMPAMMPGESTKQMQAQFQSFLKGADTAAQYQKQLTMTTERASNLPMDTQQFITTATGGMQNALATAIDMHAQQVQNSFMGGFAGGKMPSGALTSQYAKILKAAGYSPASGAGVAGYAALMGGASPSEILKITAQIKWDMTQPPAPKPVTVPVNPKIAALSKELFGPVTVPVHPKADLGSIQGMLNAIPKNIPVEVKAIGTGISEVVGAIKGIPTAVMTIVHGVSTGFGAVMSVIDAIPKSVMTIVHGAADGFGAVMSAIAAIPRFVTVTISEVVNTIGGIISGIAHHFQTGFKVPGYGGGDIWGPAMLEPGELVVPKHMVAGGEVDHLRGLIPGFAVGGLFPRRPLLPPYSWAGETPPPWTGGNPYPIVPFPGTPHGHPGVYGYPGHEVPVGTPLSGAALNRFYQSGMGAHGKYSPATAAGLAYLDHMTHLASPDQGVGAISGYGGGDVHLNVDSSGGTTLALSNAQIRQLMEVIQEKLLQQARRNQRTGIRLAGRAS